MQANLKTKVLVALALLLVVVKFALLPLLQWQNEIIEQTRQLEKRNAKSARLLQNQQQMTDELASLSKTLQTNVDIYPRYDDVTLFRLQTQIGFEALLKKNKLRQTNFFWRDDEDSQVFDNLYKAKFNVDFTGYSKDAALFHTLLMSEFKQYQIVNFSTALRAQSAKSLGYAATTYTIEAFYWRQETK